MAIQKCFSSTSTSIINFDDFSGEFSSAKTLPMFRPGSDLDRKMASTTSFPRLVLQNATSKPSGTTVKDSLFANLFGNELFSETSKLFSHRKAEKIIQAKYLDIILLKLKRGLKSFHSKLFEKITFFRLMGDFIV